MSDQPHEIGYPDLRTRAKALYLGPFINMTFILLPLFGVRALLGSIHPMVGDVCGIVAGVGAVVVAIALAHKGTSPAKLLFGYQIVDRETGVPIGILRYAPRSFLASFCGALYTSIATGPAFFLGALGHAANAGNYRDPRTLGQAVSDQHHTRRTNEVAGNVAVSGTARLMAKLEKNGVIHDNVFKTCAVKVDAKKVLSTLFKRRESVIVSTVVTEPQRDRMAA